MSTSEQYNIASIALRDSRCSIHIIIKFSSKRMVKPEERCRYGLHGIQNYILMLKLSRQGSIEKVHPMWVEVSNLLEIEFRRLTDWL